MAEPAVHLIVFSKDRPLQLHGYLTSVLQHWEGEYRVDVLVRAEPPYEEAYRQVQGEFSGAGWCWQTDFAQNLLGLLEAGREAYPYTCFGCDDVVFTGPVRVEEIGRALFPSVFGGVPVAFSLRLGRHITHDMFGREMPQPGFKKPEIQDEHWSADGLHRSVTGLRWHSHSARGDWGYPWEVLGTVYPAAAVLEQVVALADAGQATSPSQLEYHGDRRWAQTGWHHHVHPRPMCAYARSRLVVPTVNLVQSEFGNGIVGPAGLDPEFLLDCWDRGLRLDTQRYQGMAPPSWRVGDFYLRRAA
jgi:hypothetical protein